MGIGCLSYTQTDIISFHKVDVKQKTSIPTRFYRFDDLNIPRKLFDPFVHQEGSFKLVVTSAFFDFSLQLD